MASLTREQWIGAGLALVLTLGGVGSMVVMQGDLSAAAKKGKEERRKALDLPGSTQPLSD